MANNIKISQLPEITACTLTGVTVFTDGLSSYKASLSTIQDTVRNYKVYSAIINEQGSNDGSNMGVFGEGFTLGEYYFIDTYENEDDFSNVAEVIDGNINESGCYFRATGYTPNNWSNDSYLFSDGSLIINELENTTGLNIEMIRAPWGGSGYYYMYAWDNDTMDYVRLDSLGTVQVFITSTRQKTCCYNEPIITSQYVPNLDGPNSDGVTIETQYLGDGYEWSNNLLKDVTFEIRIYPKQGEIKYGDQGGFALKSNVQRTQRLRTVRTETTGITENRITKLIEESGMKPGDLKNMIIQNKTNK